MREYDPIFQFILNDSVLVSSLSVRLNVISSNVCTDSSATTIFDTVTDGLPPVLPPAINTSVSPPSTISAPLLVPLAEISALE